jgi:hypothetical protein
MEAWAMVERTKATHRASATGRSSVNEAIPVRSGTSSVLATGRPQKESSAMGGEGNKLTGLHCGVAFDSPLQVENI